jgi:cyclopropane fatty-acyl-phospholipid synthase-like methyltransferase
MKSRHKNCPVALLLASWLLLPVAAPSAPWQNERQTELANPQQAGWFYRPERVESEKPEELLEILGIKKGDVVADIGAGPGFFSLRAAQRVGPTGRVFAVDVQQEMIDGLKRMAEKSALKNIVPILGEVDDPMLPENGSVDDVLIIIAYHEFSHPREMMCHIYKAMKPDAQMLVVEYKAEDPNSRVTPAHKMTATAILSEISAFGFRRNKIIDIIPAQHVFVFKKDNPLN